MPGVEAAYRLVQDMNACSPWPTAQLKKISAVAVASLFVRTCRARTSGTVMATVIAA